MHLLVQKTIVVKSCEGKEIAGIGGIPEARTKVSSVGQKSRREGNFYGEGGAPGTEKNGRRLACLPVGKLRPYKKPPRKKPPAFAKASARHGIRRAEALQHHQALRIYVGKRGAHAIFRHGNVIGHVIFRFVAI
jgi:hypothetical protein